MAVGRFFIGKSKAKKASTPDKLLDDLRDKCSNRAEREKMLNELARTLDGLLIVSKAHHTLYSSYLIYQRLREQLHPDADLKREQRFDEGFTIELIQELQTCLGRYLSDARKHILDQEVPQTPVNSPRV